MFANSCPRTVYTNIESSTASLPEQFPGHSPLPPTAYSLTVKLVHSVGTRACRNTVARRRQRAVSSEGGDMPVHRWVKKLNLGRTANVDKALLANLGRLATDTDIPLHC